eukprot:gene12507-biopygen2208
MYPGYVKSGGINEPQRDALLAGPASAGPAVTDTFSEATQNMISDEFPDSFKQIPTGGDVLSLATVALRDGAKSGDAAVCLVLASWGADAAAIPRAEVRQPCARLRSDSGDGLVWIPWDPQKPDARGFTGSVSGSFPGWCGIPG